MKTIKKWAGLNYSQHFLVFVPAVNGCVSVSAFASLVGVSVDIASSAVGLKTRVLTTEIKKYASIFKKKKKKDDEIVLLAKTKLSTIAVLISKAYRNNSR